MYFFSGFSSPAATQTSTYIIFLTNTRILGDEFVFFQILDFQDSTLESNCWPPKKVKAIRPRNVVRRDPPHGNSGYITYAKSKLTSWPPWHTPPCQDITWLEGLSKNHCDEVRIRSARHIQIPHFRCTVMLLNVHHGFPWKVQVALGDLRGWIASCSDEP